MTDKKVERQATCAEDQTHVVLENHRFPQLAHKPVHQLFKQRDNISESSSQIVQQAKMRVHQVYCRRKG